MTKAPAAAVAAMLTAGLLTGNEVHARGTAQCWFDSAGFVQKGYEVFPRWAYDGQRFCCPFEYPFYNENTYQCTTRLPGLNDYDSPISASTYDRDERSGFALLFVVLLLLGVFRLGEGRWPWDRPRIVEEEVCRPVSYAGGFDPAPEPKKPRVILHDFNRAPAPTPNIVYVSRGGAVKGEPPQPAPKAEKPPEAKPVVQPSTNDYVKRRTDELMTDWGLAGDQAARAAQDEFKTLSADKQKREQKTREGIPPKGGR